MSESTAHTLTLLLRQCRDGDGSALARVVPLVYQELQQLARRHMARERSSHTLQATALVHEAYARLVEADLDLRDRGHFFAIASSAMRRILVDHARARASMKRGGGAQHETLDEQVPGADSDPNVLELDEALERLAAFDARKARIVELHYFGGLSYDEVARAIEVSPATVDRDLRFARAWLKGQLGREDV